MALYRPFGLAPGRPERRAGELLFRGCCCGAPREYCDTDWVRIALYPAQLRFNIFRSSLTFPLRDLIHEVRTHLLGNGHNETLALDRMAARILVEREGGLLLDLLHLEDQFF
jgi:hypothetical protein